MNITHSKNFVIPDWPAAQNIQAIVTTRQCGNLANDAGNTLHPANPTRRQLQENLELPQSPAWLKQVHGIHAVNLDDSAPALQGDASYTQTPHVVCAILTADCLPIFLASQAGHKIAAIHAGWRGLLAGVIDATIQGLNVRGTDLLAWLGPAIGPDHFEVGSEVREQFIARDRAYAAGFHQTANGSWYADLYHLATINLQHCQVDAVYGGGLCTYCDGERFYSYRREKDAAGRMASLIWMNNL